MATITFDRVNKWIIVGHLTNRLPANRAESSSLEGITLQGGGNVQIDTSNLHTLPTTIRWEPLGFGSHLHGDPLLIDGDTTYTASVWIWATGSMGHARYAGHFHWYDANFNLLGEDQSPTYDLYGLGWQRFILTATSPTTAVFVGLHLLCMEHDFAGPHRDLPGAFGDTTPGLPPWEDDELVTNPTDYLLIDGVQFEEGSVATDWHSPTDTDTSVTIQEIYDKTIDFMDNSDSMDDVQILSAEGKAVLGGGKLTVVTLKMLNGWKLKFTDRFNEPTTLCTVEDGNFVGDGYFPLQASEHVFSVISQATTGALVPGETVVVPTADEIALEVWEELLADHNTAGTFGERIAKLLTVAKFLGLR